MPISRIYQSTPLQPNSTIQLDTAATHHVARVLRANVGDKLIIFNGEGGEYEGSITHVDKKSVSISINKFIERNPESPLELYLAQGISRGEKMDYTIQKAVELGVKKIFPILTERCNVKLDEERREKRLQHWRSIVIGACEQSGRTSIPELLPPQSLKSFIENVQADWKFILAPEAPKTLKEFFLEKNLRVVLLIGPEGGLSNREIDLAMKKEFISLCLGSRVLRTETAAVTALSILQFYAGDLG